MVFVLESFPDCKELLKFHPFIKQSFSFFEVNLIIREARVLTVDSEESGFLSVPTGHPEVVPLQTTVPCPTVLTHRITQGVP